MQWCLCLALPQALPGMAQSGESHPIPSSSLETEGKKSKLACNILASLGLPESCFLSHLTHSTDENSGIAWTSGWSPLKAVAPTELHESCRETSDLQAPGAGDYRQRNTAEYLRLCEEAGVRLWGKLQQFEAAMCNSEMGGNQSIPQA